ncbi:MAG: hypothetical protein ABSG64_13000 [Solirubrobacteraceae bacterium]|jgi:hypothetical protein
MNVHTRNMHDRGVDIATGSSIVDGAAIGHVYYDDSDRNSPGLVLEIRGDQETYLPDDAAEIVSLLAARGYELDEASRADITLLCEPTVERDDPGYDLDLD